MDRAKKGLCLFPEMKKFKNYHCTNLHILIIDMEKIYIFCVHTQYFFLTYLFSVRKDGILNY